MRSFANVGVGLLCLVAAGCGEDSAGSFELTSSVVNAQGEWGLSAARPKLYAVELHELNASGVHGVALLELDGDGLVVDIEADGLEADRPHPQHIHGAETNKGNATCPPPEADSDGDGLVSIGEGLPYYGPVLLSLTPFTTAPGGSISFSEGYLVDAQALGPLQNRAMVLHGMTVGEAYVASLPVACGQLRPAGAVHFD